MPPSMTSSLASFVPAMTTLIFVGGECVAARVALDPESLPEMSMTTTTTLIAMPAPSATSDPYTHLIGFSALLEPGDVDAGVGRPGTRGHHRARGIDSPEGDRDPRLRPACV